MALKIDTVAHACSLITREIKEYQKNVTVHFIPHHEGQRTEALALAAQDILGHPASETAMHLLQKKKPSEESALLGTAVARKNLFMGLSSMDLVLSLCTINIDHFGSLKEVQRMAWHLAWHALDAVGYHSDPKNRTGNSTEIIIRERNGLEIARANLRADIFSCAMAAFHRDRESVERLAIMRGRDAMKTRALASPEFYPFVIATEATAFALKRLDPKQVSRKRVIPTALKITNEVAQTYDEISLKNWMAFAEPAQDMAWRGFDEASILSAAINTSPNTYIRAIGHMIAEVTKIQPASIILINESYSPFTDNEFNKKLHEKMVENIFQDIIAQGIRHKNAIPFTALANKQNEDLTEGRVMGWCASALHAAGEAYDAAQESGSEPMRVAAEEFEANRKNTKWDDLSELGKRVIKTQRDGTPVTMKDLEDLSRDIDGLRHLRKSVEMTIADPQYKMKLEAVREMTSIPDSFKPKLSQPDVKLQNAPAMQTPAMDMPGLGRTAKQQRRRADHPPAQTGQEDPQEENRE